MSISSAEAKRLSVFARFTMKKHRRSPFIPIHAHFIVSVAVQAATLSALCAA
jgi:hypothetical protein